MSAEQRRAILNHEIVVSAMRATALNNEAVYDELTRRASDTLGVALGLSGNAGVKLSDKALIDIICAAVRPADPAQAADMTRQALFSWTGQPDAKDFCLPWENRRGKAKTATAPEAPTPHIPEITEERGAELTRMQGEAALMDQAVLDAEDVFRALGQIEAFEFTRQVADLAAAQAFEKMKVGKKYKGLPYRDKDGNTRHVASLEEFCEVKLGRSLRRMQELAQNLHTLGSDLYESAERIGFRARDYAALKALPAEEQAVVKQALASESKEQVLDILQDMAARHAAEKAAAQKQTEELSADLDALDKLLKDKSEKLDGLTVKLEKLRSLPENKRQKLRLEQEEQAATKLTEAVIGAQAAINELCRQLADIKAAEISIYTREYADQTASWFCQQVQLALQENGIQADMTEIVLPAWMRESAKASPVAEALG